MTNIYFCKNLIFEPKDFTGIFFLDLVKRNIYEIICQYIFPPKNEVLLRVHQALRNSAMKVSIEHVEKRPIHLHGLEDAASNVSSLPVTHKAD